MAILGRLRPDMSTNPKEINFWDRYQRYLIEYKSIDFSLDVSRMFFDDYFLERKRPMCEAAIAEMKRIEAGEKMNADEDRPVGHYWLRNSALAPAELRDQIDADVVAANDFGRDVREGKIRGGAGETLKFYLFIGIGGSALGPRLVTAALADQKMREGTWFFDNTDPEGIDRVIDEIGKERLRQTLVVVTSKSGNTPETRNGMLEAKRAFEERGLNFGRHAVSVTGEGSALWDLSERWIHRFPMYDWVGGRTSVMSMVGLVPAALQGIKINDFLAGAKAMDDLTRDESDPAKNAAMMLALMWHWAGDGIGKKDMVILPYKDRLSLFANYLQQLIMESLGKELDREGGVVNQGITVYGNKGSTDQHAYVQQLRDGLNNFFATFIEVRNARGENESIIVDEDANANSGDFLQGFLRGTRKALTEGERESITISIEQLDTFRLGMLIALFERAVGFYASFVNVNAYHQPGVESGKKAAEVFLKLMSQVRQQLLENPENVTPETIATQLGADPEDVRHILTHLSSNPRAIPR
ncbi:MAG: glucose-6-phosphate isomerase [Verrucomicrobiales bacterium]|jgi:glucose-6-phosphate isomerase